MTFHDNIREIPKDNLKLIRIDLVEKISQLEREVDSLPESHPSIRRLKDQQDSYATAFNIIMRLEKNQTDDHIRKREGLSYDGLNIFYRRLLEIYNSLQSSQ